MFLSSREKEEIKIKREIEKKTKADAQRKAQLRSDLLELLDEKLSLSNAYSGHAYSLSNTVSNIGSMSGITSATAHYYSSDTVSTKIKKIAMEAVKEKL